jgi:hypothetical protein
MTNELEIWRACIICATLSSILTSIIWAVAV